jgi:antitoxin ParD1/3/4
MEALNDKRAALRSHLAEGEAQARNGEFIKDFSVDSLIDELDMEE